MQAVRARVRAAAERASRAPQSVTIIAASKTQSADAVRRVHAAGIDHFGENYLTDALEKMSATTDLPVTWHFIGRIQSNKTRRIAQAFDWVHTVDRQKIAARLDDGARDAGKTLNVCIQVNVDADDDKGGVAPETLGELLETVRPLTHLRVRGLMTIGAVSADPEQTFARLADLFHTHAPPEGGCWDTLSMGMSGDLEAAIAAGATQVRIGTALFGPRPARAV